MASAEGLRERRPLEVPAGERETNGAESEPKGGENIMNHVYPAKTAEVRELYGEKGHASPEYVLVDEQQAHRERHKAILQAHPEVRELICNDPSLAFWIVAINVIQLALAWVSQHYLPAWAIGLLFYTVGATCMHSMWVLVHECTHNVLSKIQVVNNIWMLIANITIVVPAVISFKHFHIRHHQNLNDAYSDPDLPGPFEVWLAGNSPWRKALWLLFFPIFMSVRMLRYSAIHAPPLGWVIVNLITQAIAIVLMYHYIGGKGLAYLGLSSFASISLHPFGARWIQEHYAFLPDQETYSYYGIANWLCFNIGYHNEHHDFASIPAKNLPKLKEIATEFYDPLYSHTSYRKLLWTFIVDPSLSLKSRVVRKTERSTKSTFW